MIRLEARSREAVPADVGLSHREWGIFTKHRLIDRLSGRPYIRGWGKR